MFIPKDGEESLRGVAHTGGRLIIPLGGRPPIDVGGYFSSLENWMALNVLPPQHLSILKHNAQQSTVTQLKAPRACIALGEQFAFI